MDCLNNIIGLSETTCNCEGTPPTDYNLSRSGIFLDQLEGIELKTNTGADGCENGGIWDRMARAVRNATNEFTSDMLSCVQLNYKAKKSNWGGLLGNTTFTGAVNPMSNYAGIKIQSLSMKGAYLYIKRIGILVNTTGPVTVNIYSNENGSTLVDSFIVNAVANTLTYAVISPEPLELPLWSYNKSMISYYALLDLTPATFLPLNNQKDCNCGGANTKPYLNWLDFNGGKINNINDFTTFVPSNNKELYGIILDVETKCKMSQVICTDEEPLDFLNDGYAKKMAFAIRFKAGYLLLNDLYNSPNINRFTLMEKEKLVAYMKFYTEEYNKWVSFLCENVQIDNNSCFTCKAEGIIKTRILI
jgi:hypothetical protein